MWLCLVVEGRREQEEEDIPGDGGRWEADGGRGWRRERIAGVGGSWVKMFGPGVCPGVCPGVQSPWCSFEASEYFHPLDNAHGHYGQKPPPSKTRSRTQQKERLNTRRVRSPVLPPKISQDLRDSLNHFPNFCFTGPTRVEPPPASPFVPRSSGTHPPTKFPSRPATTIQPLGINYFHRRRRKIPSSPPKRSQRSCPDTPEFVLLSSPSPHLLLCSSCSSSFFCNLCDSCCSALFSSLIVSSPQC